MKKSGARKARSGKRQQGRPSGDGRDNGPRQTAKGEAFFSHALETTPGGKGVFRASLGKPMHNPRYKYTLYEGTVVGSQATSTAATPLISINQGLTDITRIGDRIKIKRFQMRGKIYGSASATGPTAARLVVFLWKNPQVSANAPISGEILQANAGYLPWAAYTRDYGDLVQILYDATFSVEKLETSTELELFAMNIPSNIEVGFAATGTDPLINGLYLMLVTDTAANQPSVTFQSTMWFEDNDA